MVREVAVGLLPSPAMRERGGGEGQRFQS